MSAAMDSPKPLKACPFCGGPGYRSAGAGDGCKVCALFVEPELWNRRALSPVVAEVVKRLRELADGVRPIDYAPTAEGEYNYYAQLADELDGLADRLERGE